MIIADRDFDFGIKLADWLAARGYQAVLVRSVETAMEDCRDLRPQALCIGLSRSESTSAINLPELLRTIETTYPRVPVVTMGDGTSGDPTHLLSGRAIRHFPVKPIEVTDIGHALQSQLRAAAASLASSGTRSGSHNEWAMENLSHERGVHGEAAQWMR
jgi:DNA-binding NtrC family response regulator